jgi:hypothetical protein
VKLTLLALALMLAACSGPKDTVLPREMQKMDSIAPAMRMLTDEERKLVSGYMMRHTFGPNPTLGSLLLSGKGFNAPADIPEGMTIGKAIEEQRKFRDDASAEEVKQAALKAKLEADREAIRKPMRDAVTVTLVSKTLKTNPSMGAMGDRLEVVFGYKNNTSKDIAGVKGRVTVKDLFGDHISTFPLSYDTTLPAGQSQTSTGGRMLFSFGGGSDDRRLSTLDADKYRVVWEPQIIVFTDGTKLSVNE